MKNIDAQIKEISHKLRSKHNCLHPQFEDVKSFDEELAEELSKLIQRERGLPIMNKKEQEAARERIVALFSNYKYTIDGEIVYVTEGNVWQVADDLLDMFLTPVECESDKTRFADTPSIEANYLAARGETIKQSSPKVPEQEIPKPNGTVDKTSTISRQPQGVGVEDVKKDFHCQICNRPLSFGKLQLDGICEDCI